MNKQEYVEFISSYEVDEERIAKVKELYSIEQATDLFERIVSAAGEVTSFDEERRALTFDGIIYANEDLGVDFAERGIVPVIDAYNLDYIVYMINEAKWGIYNISDDDVYDESDDLLELL